MRKLVLFFVLPCLIIFSIPAISFSQTPVSQGSTYRGDINEDGLVNIFDLLEMLKMLPDPAVQPARARQIADVDASGVVNIFDLLGLLNLLSGAQEPGIIYWEPTILSVSSRVAAVGDTLVISVGSFRKTITADSVKACMNSKEVDLLEFSHENIKIIVPQWFTGGELKLVVGADTSNSINIIKTEIFQGMPMISIPAGSFKMGSRSIEIDEGPVHVVALDTFQMSATEITNSQYAAFLNEAIKTGEVRANKDSVIGGVGYYPGYEYLSLSESDLLNNKCRIIFNDSSFSVEPTYEHKPVTFVTWYGAAAFAAHYDISLPTEAEWEYACRGGQQLEFGTDDGTISLEKANYDKHIASPTDVGSYPANPFGLVDMAGNVSEWCKDWYDLKYYSNSPSKNPPGPVFGTDRVGRGGGWHNCDSALRSANRTYYDPHYRISYLGFRVVRR
ncbi:MAG TPA: SUMF1/EgtB/PvdO family nonheme iron enzyme [archaeon]|nr:SUMF1/EgtB/PvdO family nonheme iron enzyme [archaeon]